MEGNISALVMPDLLPLYLPAQKPFIRLSARILKVNVK